MESTISKVILPAAILASCLTGCSESVDAGTSKLTGTVAVDGSSTVFPITEAVAEEFGKVHPRVRITVGVSGTGGGFKKFCVGTTAINDASRPIKAKESQLAAENKVEFIELPVAYDGLTVVVHKENTFVDQLTVAELKEIWQPGSQIKNWNQVRDGFPDLAMPLYGPGTDSGTFDYFTKAVNGKEQACRADFTASEDDNVLVKGVAGDKGALGFFGYAYYAENQDKLRAVPIVNKQGKATTPTLETITDGTYTPLSRPIFIYVSKAAAAQPVVKEFVEFYIDQASTLAEQVGYVKLPSSVYEGVRRRFDKHVTGSVYAAEDAENKTLEQLYK